MKVKQLTEIKVRTYVWAMAWVRSWIELAVALIHISTLGLWRPNWDMLFMCNVALKAIKMRMRARDER